MPMFSMEGKYEVDGLVIGVPMQGNGNVFLNFCKSPK